MKFLVSFFLSIVIYFFIAYFFFYVIMKNRHRQQVIEFPAQKAYIHQVIRQKPKPKKKIPIQTEKKEIKKTIVSKTTDDVSKGGEKNIAFDDIFSSVDSNINDVKKLKVAKKDTIVNSNTKKKESMIEYVKQKTDDLKLNDNIKIQLSKDANVTDEKLTKFYKDANLIWQSFDLKVGDTAVFVFDSNGFKLIYTNLNNEIKDELCKKLQSLDFNVLSGSIKITFMVKEEK